MRPTIAYVKAFSPLLLEQDGSGNPRLRTRYVVITGGRGSGKSFHVSTALASWVRHAGWRALFTRWTMASAHDSIIPEFKEKIDIMNRMEEYKLTRQDIRHSSGSSILFRGIKTSSGNQTAKLKSLQGINCWVLDEAEEMQDERTFDIIDLSIRDKRHPNVVILVLNPPQKKHWIYRRFFESRGIPDVGFNGVVDDTTYIHTDYRDNLPNLPESYLKRARAAKKGDPRLYKSVWLGAWMDEVIGALWSYSMIADHRVERKDVPDLIRCGVGIDPNVSYGESADEAGIVTAGQGSDGHYYVLNDASGRFGPSEWGRIAVQEYDHWKADRVIGEANNGGDMVGENVERFRPHIPYLKVHASRGKIPRAAPISTLYAQGMVHHVGRFPELEAEMMSYTGMDPNQASPNRMDGMIWALNWLAQILPQDQVGQADAERQRRMRTLGAV